MSTNLKHWAPALALVCTFAVAQPATKPASNSGGSAKVVGAGGGPILSFRELEACLKQEAAVKKRLSELESVRASVDAEKAVIVADQQALKADRAPIDDVKARVEDLSQRMRDYASRVDTWNKSVADFNGEGYNNNRQAEARRGQINAEREKLEVERTALDAEKQRLTSESAEAVKTFNVKATGIDARVTAWNQRNAEANSMGTSIEADRQAWVAGCANRRYREDDEAAIKRGN